MCLVTFLPILVPPAASPLLRQCKGFPRFAGRFWSCPGPLGKVPCRSFNRPRKRRTKSGKSPNILGNPEEIGKIQKKRQRKDKSGRMSPNREIPHVWRPPFYQPLFSSGLNLIRFARFFQQFHCRTNWKGFALSVLLTEFSVRNRPRCKLDRNEFNSDRSLRLPETKH